MQLSMKERTLNHPDKTVIIDYKSLVQTDVPRPYLVVYIGNDSGRRHMLKKGFMTIGRSPKADIVIEDDRISRIHCIIEWLGDTITIEDKGSTNGTFLDSRKISRAILQAGVPLQLGHSIMKIEYKSEAEIQSEENLLHKASFDALTGIFNRHHFIKLASMEMTYASRHKLPLGVILMDIDNFKHINDTYGHQNGDSVLTQFANTVIEEKRTEDLFARYGGDEFILLPRGEVTKEDIQVQCERIRRAVESCTFYFDETSVRMTISLGFHLMKVESRDVEKILFDLIQKADQALYLAKEKGRNRTESLV